MAGYKLLDAAAGNARGVALGIDMPGERMFCFSGTIGAATISIDLSNDGGATWIATGATFAAGSLDPQLVMLKAGQQVSCNQTGVGGGTTSTVEIV